MDRYTERIKGRERGLKKNMWYFSASKYLNLFVKDVAFNFKGRVNSITNSLLLLLLVLLLHLLSLLSLSICFCVSLERGRSWLYLQTKRMVQRKALAHRFHRG